MLTGKIALAAEVFTASSLFGVGLGSYTLGGFHVREPVDIISEMGREATAASAPAPVAPPDVVAHVCTGCDAKPYRDRNWDWHPRSEQAEDAKVGGELSVVTQPQAPPLPKLRETPASDDMPMPEDGAEPDRATGATDEAISGD